jgi:ribose-phosphate pyrophosphokinase
MEQLIMIDAARRASAKRITAVCPFYGYARQDRKAEGREPITAKLVADMFKAAGAKRIMSVDLHSGQIQGFFDGPVDHLTAMPVLVDYMREPPRRRPGGRVARRRPGEGGRALPQHLHADLAIVTSAGSRA